METVQHTSLRFVHSAYFIITRRYSYSLNLFVTVDFPGHVYDDISHIHVQYIHVYMYIYTHIYTYIYTHIHIYMHIHVCIYTHTYVHMHIYTHTFSREQMHAYAHITLNQLIGAGRRLCLSVIWTIIRPELPIWHQATIWTNTGLTWFISMNFLKITIFYEIFLRFFFFKLSYSMESILSRSQCVES